MNASVKGQADSPSPVNMTSRGLEALGAFRKEIATYRRELPRLLDEHQAGKYALIQEDQVHGTFPSWAAAKPPMPMIH